jgi:hypothetical protein
MLLNIQKRRVDTDVIVLGLAGSLDVPQGLQFWQDTDSDRRRSQHFATSLALIEWSQHSRIHR